MTAAQKKKRTANKAERAKRREEITARWRARTARMWLQAEIGDGTLRGVSQEHALHCLLHYSKWETFDALVATLNPAAVPHLLSKALRVIQLKEMPYADYLETPEWKAKAEIAKMSFGGKCALADDHEAADAHHRTYERRGRELKEDIVPLCRDCHSKFHGRK